MKTFSIPLRVVFYKDQGDWVAHCLEFDLCGDGKTKAGALRSLDAAIKIQVEQSVRHDNFRNLFSPADGEILQRFAAGKHVTVGKFQFQLKAKGKTRQVVLEGPDTREFTGELTDSALISAN